MSSVRIALLPLPRLRPGLWPHRVKHSLGFMIETNPILPGVREEFHDTAGALVSTLWIIAIPLVDAIPVPVIRISKRVAMYRGDQNHFFHSLLPRGLGPGWGGPLFLLERPLARLRQFAIPSRSPRDGNGRSSGRIRINP